MGNEWTDIGVSRRLALGICLLVAGPMAAASATPADAFEARGSAKQVYATELEPGAKVKLFDRKGRKVGVDRANDLGGALFRRVKPGRGYKVRSKGRTSERTIPSQSTSVRASSGSAETAAREASRSRRKACTSASRTAT